ncbi:unnamed protein product [Cunninghamella echinulata]
MIYKRKFYTTVLLLTISSAIIVRGEANNQQHHEHQEVIAQHFTNPIKKGQEIYQQAIELLEPLSAIQKKNKSPISLEEKTDKQRLFDATQLLKEAADKYGNKDALLLLGDMYFYKKYYQPRDYKLAFDYYQKLANTGNATAQHILGFMYSTGIDNVVERDQAQALLYLTFAALGGNTAAEMTLGYRYYTGIGTEQSCNDAVYYYKRVAEKAIKEYLSGPPGGLSLPYSKVRLSDDKGGVYGYGASHVTDKSNRQSSDKTVSIEEVLNYLKHLAIKKDDIEAQFMLVDTYYHGSRNVPRNFEETIYFLGLIVSKIPKEKIPESLVKSKKGRIMGQAAGYLGRMYLRGEGVTKNTQKAYQWFQIGTEFNDSISFNGLGMIFMTPENEDYKKALENFKKASNLKNADAHVNLAGEYIKGEETLSAGIQLLDLARKSNHVLAYWYLGQLYEQGLGMDNPSCPTAVSFYKGIAEGGDWSMPTVNDAYDAYKNGDMETALLNYMLAAERGYEVAQLNVAYLLDTNKVALSIPEKLGLQEAPTRNNYTEQLALIYWSRSANQNNVDARVKMGDYYYYGIGTPVDYEKAASCYRVAVEFDVSPMAMWNLGWMYENGIGVAKDYHLAKRQYDNALATNGNAYLPVKLSLLKLHLKYYWEWLINGDASYGPFSSSSSQEAHDSLNKNQQQLQREEIAGETTVLENARRRNHIEGQDNERQREDKLRMQYNKHIKELDDHDDLDDLVGKRNYNKRHGADQDGINDDEDDLEYSEEDELVESLIILGICLLVGWLVYVRQFRFGNNRQQQQQQQQQG